MKFDKNKSDLKNINILKREIKMLKGPYSKILIKTLFNSSDADEFRIMIKNKVTEYIKTKIKVND